MSEEPIGNLLVAQFGSSTATMNASLAGIVTEALNHDSIEDIYGCLNGVQGLLNESFIDLAEESQQTIRALCHTPGVALGTSSHALKTQQEINQILEIFEAHNIRFFFSIGGREAQAAAWTIAQAAEAKGYILRVISVPKAANNDLPMLDHSPGYGSVIKHIATVVREISFDHHSRNQQGLVTILEVMGQQSGWVAAGSILAKRKGNEQDAPHIILMPERAFSESSFIEEVQMALQKYKNCVIVTSDGLVNAEGNYITNEAEIGVADKLAEILRTQLSLQANTVRLGLTQVLAAQSISKTDSNEAFLAGQAAIQAAVAGKTAKMVTLLRGETDAYSCETGLAALEECVEASSKPFPEAWLNVNGASGISHQFFKYANPLIQGEVEVPHDHGLPRFSILSMRRVSKKVTSSVIS